MLTPNYYLDFVRSNIDAVGDYQVFRVLQTFTQYEARIYEQALQSFINPALNGYGDITFTTKWVPEDSRTSLLGSRPFIAITEAGDRLEFSSMSSGSEILGTSRKTIETIINYPNNYTSCPGIGQTCKFIELNCSPKEGSPYNNPYLRPSLDGIDYNTLPLGVVSAFNEDFTYYGQFQNSSDAAIQCGFGNKYYNVSRCINNRFVSCIIGGVTIKLLFAQNPLSKGRTKPVICTDTLTGEITNYKSVNDCTRAISTRGIAFSTDLIKGFIKPGKLFKGRYLITYVVK